MSDRRPRIHSIDRNGWPVVRLADSPGRTIARPAHQLPLALTQDVLTIAQTAHVLDCTISDAEQLVVRASVPRVVGWPRADVEALRERLKTDPALRSELGIAEHTTTFPLRPA